MKHASNLALALLLLVSFPALAVQPDEVLRDPALEQRARDISAGLRCLVCQNQSIDESDAPLARDLRGLVRERLKTGESNAQVREFVVQRYGEFVLLRPVFGMHTALLWLTPLIVVGLGGLGLFLALRRRQPTPSGLSEAEQAALDALLRKERPAADGG
ncbi:MAG: Cytochrome c heme lyase subunit CcmL [uncultured Microvirga sp.]|uniref:Cytochrome c-type biogenesis protein n=1 Tax=uncultured Microvirga sp. TaxID=412392 RepID=A0A6J4L6E7_9HYPH|nr:MAG: Cytochrome c heme lyase subunit CcmL [uncultured Microvirga sp.]